jgi:hypothetical protein
VKNLTDLLQRFSGVLNKKTVAKEMVIEVIKKRTNVTIQPENISISIDDGVLQITASPAVKNEIAFKEKIIFDELKEVHNLRFNRILYK